MKKIRMLILLVVNGLFGNCATAGFGPFGYYFTDSVLPVDATKTKSSKSAKNCVQNVLGLVAWGGKSIQEIGQEKGINTVNSVHYEPFSILGVYARLCVVVEGD